MPSPAHELYVLVSPRIVRRENEEFQVACEMVSSTDLYTTSAGDKQSEPREMRSLVLQNMFIYAGHPDAAKALREQLQMPNDMPVDDWHVLSLAPHGQLCSFSNLGLLLTVRALHTPPSLAEFCTLRPAFCACRPSGSPPLPPPKIPCAGGEPDCRLPKGPRE